MKQSHTKNSHNLSCFLNQNGLDGEREEMSKPSRELARTTLYVGRSVGFAYNQIKLGVLDFPVSATKLHLR